MSSRTTSATLRLLPTPFTCKSEWRARTCRAGWASPVSFVRRRSTTIDADCLTTRSSTCRRASGPSDRYPIIAIHFGVGRDRVAWRRSELDELLRSVDTDKARTQRTKHGSLGSRECSAAASSKELCFQQQKRATQPTSRQTVLSSLAERSVLCPMCPCFVRVDRAKKLATQSATRIAISASTTERAAPVLGDEPHRA